KKPRRPAQRPDVILRNPRAAQGSPLDVEPPTEGKVATISDVTTPPTVSPGSDEASQRETTSPAPAPAAAAPDLASESTPSRDAFTLGATTPDTPAPIAHDVPGVPDLIPETPEAGWDAGSVSLDAPAMRDGIAGEEGRLDDLDPVAAAGGAEVAPARPSSKAP